MGKITQIDDTFYGPKNLVLRIIKNPLFLGGGHVSLTIRTYITGRYITGHFGDYIIPLLGH